MRKDDICMELNIEVSYNEFNKCADVRFINSEGDEIIAPEHISGSKTFKFNIANSGKNDNAKAEIDWGDDNYVSVMRALLKTMGDNELLRQQIDELTSEKHEMYNTIEKLKTNQLNSSRKARSELIDKLVKDVANLRSANTGLAVELAETKNKLEIADGVVNSQANTISDMKTEYTARDEKYKYRLNNIYGISGSITVTDEIREDRDLYLNTIQNIARACSGHQSLSGDESAIVLDNISEILIRLEDSRPGIFCYVCELNHKKLSPASDDETDDVVYKDIREPESSFWRIKHDDGDLIVKIPDCDVWTETVSESSCDAPEKKPEFDSKIPSDIVADDVVYKLDDTTPFYDIGRKNIESDTIRHLGQLFIADDDLADFNRIFKYTMISRNTFTINDLINWSSPKGVLKHRFQIVLG
jgi:hypothetical protein